MTRKLLLTLLVLVILIPVMVLLAGQYLFHWEPLVRFGIGGAQAVEQSADEAARVVEEFYRWYRAYPGNAFAERAYRESPLLAPAFIQELDAEIEAMNAAGPGGADPILCAQDIPGEMRYGVAEVDGKTATAVVQQVWNPGTEFESIRELTVELQQSDAEWLIGDITCPVP